MEGHDVEDRLVRGGMGLAARVMTRPRKISDTDGSAPSANVPTASQAGLRVYVATLAAVALLVVLTSASLIPADAEPKVAVWLLLTALFAAVEFTDLSFHSNGGRVGLSGSEAILCPMIVGLPFPFAVWGATAGVAAVQLWRRRREPMKLAFNVAQFACASAVAAWLFHVLEQPGPGFTVGDAAAAAAATLAFSVITHVLAEEAVALASGRAWPSFSRDVPAALLNAISGVALGLLFAAAFATATWSVVLFPVPLGVVYAGVRAFLRQTRERERVQALHAASRALAASPELGIAVVGFLHAVADMVGASRALVVVESRGRVLWSEVGPGGTTASLEPAEQGPRHHLLVAVKRAGEPIVVTEDHRTEARRGLARRLKTRNLAVVPLQADGDVVGCLAAVDRSGADEFGDQETRILAALGGELMLTLEAHRLFDEAAEQRERFQRVFEDGPLGMAIVDRDLRLTSVNKALCAMLGYKDEELVGNSLLAITHPDDAWSDLHQTRQALRGEISGYQVEKRYLSKDDAIVPGSLTATVVRDGRGEVLYGLHIIEDITDRKRAEESLRAYAEELAQANQELRVAGELKDHFLAVTNHELRTPLTSILGFASMLSEDWDGLADADRRDFAGRIKRQAGRLSALIEDLLTLSSAQAGALEMTIEPVELEAAVRDAIHSVGPGRDVLVRCPQGLRVMADPEGLFRIVSNYLSNAFRHGRSPVSVEAWRTGGWVEIKVKDAGPGVPPEFVPRLFDKFAQADRGVSGPTRGTGLGLAIVRELANAQGGQAWYEAGQLKGSTFCLRLPAAVDRRDERTEPAVTSEVG